MDDKGLEIITGRNDELEMKNGADERGEIEFNG